MRPIWQLPGPALHEQERVSAFLTPNPSAETYNPNQSHPLPATPGLTLLRGSSKSGSRKPSTTLTSTTDPHLSDRDMWGGHQNPNASNRVKRQKKLYHKKRDRYNHQHENPDVKFPRKFDSTLGYPGEGPAKKNGGASRNKPGHKGQPRVRRGAPPCSGHKSCDYKSCEIPGHFHLRANNPLSGHARRKREESGNRPAPRKKKLEQVLCSISCHKDCLIAEHSHSYTQNKEWEDSLKVSTGRHAPDIQYLEPRNRVQGLAVYSVSDFPEDEFPLDEKEQADLVDIEDLFKPQAKRSIREEPSQPKHNTIIAHKGLNARNGREAPASISVLESDLCESDSDSSDSESDDSEWPDLDEESMIEEESTQPLEQLDPCGLYIKEGVNIRTRVVTLYSVGDSSTSSSFVEGAARFITWITFGRVQSHTITNDSANVHHSEFATRIMTTRRQYGIGPWPFPFLNFFQTNHKSSLDYVGGIYSHSWNGEIYTEMAQLAMSDKALLQRVTVRSDAKVNNTVLPAIVYTVTNLPGYSVWSRDPRIFFNTLVYVANQILIRGTQLAAVLPLHSTPTFRPSGSHLNVSVSALFTRLVQSIAGRRLL